MTTWWSLFCCRGLLYKCCMYYCLSVWHDVYLWGHSAIFLALFLLCTSRDVRSGCSAVSRQTRAQAVVNTWPLFIYTMCCSLTQTMRDDVPVVQPTVKPAVAVSCLILNCDIMPPLLMVCASCVPHTAESDWHCWPKFCVSAFISPGIVVKHLMLRLTWGLEAELRLEVCFLSAALPTSCCIYLPWILWHETPSGEEAHQHNWFLPQTG